MPLISEYMPPRFATEGALDRLAARMALLPAPNLFAFELHLGRDEPQIDLSQRFDSPSEARRFADALGDGSLDFLLDPWERGDLPDVANLWIEMDIDPSVDGAKRPEVLACIGLRPNLEPGWADRLGRHFRSGGLSVPQKRTLDDALAHLAELDGRPIYFFDLEPRSPGLVRLDTIGLDPERMTELLSRMGSTRAVRQLEALPAWTADMERHHVSFDILPDGSLGERLGIELSNVKTPERDARWERLFEHLVNDQLCDEETRCALIDWVGKDDRHTATSVWPDAPGLNVGCSVRCLSHVKLLSWPDRPLAAKVYLLLAFLDREALERLRARRTS